MALDIDRRQAEVIDALIALTGVALTRDRQALALPLFEAARRFRPSSPRLESFEGWFCLHRGDLAGAQRHLSSAVDKLGDEAGSARSLLAMVLCALGDPGWAAHAEAVIHENRDPHGVYLMKSMRGDPDAVQPASAVRPAGPSVLLDDSDEPAGADGERAASPGSPYREPVEPVKVVRLATGRQVFLRG